ncbi:MAG: DNA-formamidopyrimidine glycosylase family protein [Chloroflexota bacterium]
MIELPEAIIIARQINAELAGKQIAAAVHMQSPHKFAFISGRTPEEHAAILQGRTLGAAVASGSSIVLDTAPGYKLVFGCGGERIVYHTSAATLPKKHQLLLRFADDTYLTVTVQGWGNVFLLTDEEARTHRHVGFDRLGALHDAFTSAYWEGLFATLPPDDKRAIKYFLISEPGVWGLGNGYLQDILFHARLHPRHRAADVTTDERRALYTVLRETLQRAVDLGGRDSERDLHDHPGGYARLMDSTTAGQPCPACGAPIEKISFLGGTCYFCPQCQK